MANGIRCLCGSPSPTQKYKGSRGRFMLCRPCHLDWQGWVADQPNRIELDNGMVGLPYVRPVEKWSEDNDTEEAAS